MIKAFLSLGSNVGDRHKFLSRAIRYINVGIGHIIDLSGVYETEAWGFDTEEKFLNMAVEIMTDYSPAEMLQKCHEIETKLGRERSDNEGYVSRPIDVDILLYANEIIDTPELTIPHKHLHERRFVLEPLSEISPDYVHPVLKLTIKELLKQCTDDKDVNQLGAIFYDS
ncbi:MAG: 2-amino-4-hydroxy-6-hydroxymethyldihydropteridine diphosphokinase [Prolixibacteraceae bacterium]|jgi:2-amino-4-hydroxy-6-hydroxymethyldihydropteridine diphosphokinase|nr:2-amino-4-hydroxy-6-hydroxymethyldihydropteridine diphosphokinase [Prolixibacteraceae bacterium]